MAREGGRGGFNAAPDTGRKGYREPWEPVDERPLIAYDSCRCKACRGRAGLWRDDMERQVYEAAVSLNPRLPGEGALAYAKRISEIVVREQDAARGGEQ